MNIKSYDTEITNRIISKCYAKINLFLKITGKRPDGYHDLTSLMVFADFYDELSFSKSIKTSFHVEGLYAAKVPLDQQNLIFKAIRALEICTNNTFNVDISLIKNLPIAAGIGGGSSNAAETLKALNTLFELGLNFKELTEIGLKLGDDVPVSLLGRSCLRQGQGDVLEPIEDLPEFYMVLVNPQVAVPTPKAFSYVQKYSCPLPNPFKIPSKLDDFVAMLKTQGNDLLEPALQIAPIIGEVMAEIENLPHCLMAQMSGSGATCFGIFATKNQTTQAFEIIQAKHPQWWSHSCAILK